MFRDAVVDVDLDAFRHLNNGATGRYFEEGRSDLNMRVFGPDCMTEPEGGLQLLFATVTIDYLKQAHYPGKVEIGSGVRKIGTSSYVISQAAFQNGTCFALAEAVMVKAIDGLASPLTSSERELLSGLITIGA